MKRVVAVGFAVGVLLGCHDQQRLTSPARISGDFSDGSVAGGNAHFFFLPPLVGNPSFSGTFNPNIRPVVRICQLDVDPNNLPLGCDAVAAPINPGTPLLDALGQQYQVDWDTGLLPIDLTKSYRIQVQVAPGGSVLGYADIAPVELKNVNTNQFIGLVDGRILPIKFRIEVGAFCKTTDCFEGTVGPAGGTFITSSGLAGTLFPVGALTQDAFLVIDRIDQRPCVPTDLPQFPGCYRFTTDPPPSQFLLNVTVGMCVDAPGLTHAQLDQLQIARFDPNQPVQLLPNVPAAFLTCDPHHLASRLPPGLRELARLLRALVLPAALHATHLGVGGSSGSYSIFTWGLPVELGINDGNLQTATAGAPVATPPSVVVTDTATGTALPVAGATVTFTVTSGGGTITNPVVVTGADGIARVGSWTLGSPAGVNTLTATTAGAVGLTPLFTATGTLPLPPPPSIP